MANYRMNKLNINGDTYECAEWYGVCSTAAATQAKTVSISGFTSAQLVEGCRVVVRFANHQNYDGAPTLNVSATGAKTIQSVSGTSAGQYEWQAGQIVAFVYYNGYWVIEDGNHANTYRWGKTMLSSAFPSTNSGLAATPDCVINAGRFILNNSCWNGEKPPYQYFTVTTPSSADWGSSYELWDYGCAISVDLTSFMQRVNSISGLKVIRATYQGKYAIAILEPFATVSGFDTSAHDGIYVSANTNNGEIRLDVEDSSDVGAHELKIELFACAQLVTYPTLDYYMKSNGYLTLADLPVWDGSVT